MIHRLWDDPEDEGDLAYLAASDAYEIEPDQRRELMKLSYPQYRKTPHWDHMRRRALLRAGHQCQRCEATNRRLDVHHRTYDRLGRETEADLIVLCSRCHASEHGIDDYEVVVQRLGERDAEYFSRSGDLAAVAARIRRHMP